MTIERAITLAIEGGWETNIRYPELHFEKILLDPSFWSSLGKAMGWADEICIQCADENDGEPMYCEICEAHDASEYHSPQLEWSYRWHFLIDHLANNGSIEDYFEKL